MSDTAGAGDAWDALVSVALLGTARKPVDDVPLPPELAAAASAGAGADPAERLLDLAALLAVYRRAGGPTPAPTPAATAPATPAAATPSAHQAPTPDANLRNLPPPATARLTDLLRGVGTNTGGMLAIWLRAAAERGFSVPPEFLPELLDLALARPPLRPPITALTGSRGRWLAAHRADWRTLLLEPGPPPGPGTDSPATDPVWTHGTPAERQAWFIRLRDADPGAARQLLAQLDWAHEDGAMRLALVRALQHQLGPGDEPVLELARADRRKDVRVAAAALLAQLPESEYVRAATRLARACLTVDREKLTVTLPDPALGPADFAVPSWLRGQHPASAAAVLLWYLISIVPLRVWDDADPAQLIALPVSDGLAAIVHNGWDDAAVQQRNAEWAMALMGSRDPASIGPLLQALPAERRAGVVVSALNRNRKAPEGFSAPSLDAILRNVPPPWPADLTRALLVWLERESDESPIWGAFPLLARFGENLPATPEIEASLRGLARNHPVNSSWYPALTEVATTLQYRREMLEELR